MRLAFGIILCLLATDADARRRLSKREVRECRLKGGYESVSGFGYPLCQFDYTDGGKSCRGKTDCQGRCLAEVPDNYRAIPVGSAVAGQCEFKSSTFGCHGEIQNGKLTADGWICVD